METTTSKSLSDLQEANLTAVGYAAANAAQNAVSAALRQPISRPAYEAECASASLAPWSDDKIRRATYALTFADMPTDPAGWLEYGLARQRLVSLKREQVRPVVIEPATANCSACGRELPRASLMNASRRSGVCPECYDRFSD